MSTVWTLTTTTSSWHKQSEQSRLEVDVKRINLKVYDNGVVDNDTVSIFYNGKLLLSHQRLSETPIIIDLNLDERGQHDSLQDRFQ